MSTVFSGYVGLHGIGSDEDVNLATLIEELDQFCSGGYTLTMAQGRYDGQDELSAVVCVIAKHGHEPRVRQKLVSALLAYKAKAHQEEVWLTTRTEDLIIL